MIVRIIGEGQFRLTDECRERVNELDNAVVAAVEAGDRDAFASTFGEMLAMIRSDGQALSDDELEASDVIVPPEDTTLEEAAAEFTGDGLIPD